MRFPFRETATVFVLLVATALYSQTSYPQMQDEGVGDVQQNEPSQSHSGQCFDPTTGLPVQCSADSVETGSQLRQSAVPGALGPERLGSRSAADDTGLAGQSRLRDSTRMPELAPEPPTEFQKFVAETTGQILPIYGAKLFRDVPTTFSPDDLSPVTADYVVGPNDELRIRIWGQASYNGNVRVDRSGNIYIPEVGAIHVAGLQFSALESQLRTAVGRVFRNFDLSVDIGRIRSMQVYVTGQARRPGAYIVSSLSSLVDAIFASGGPSAQGSLRHLQLSRGGQLIADFDLYRLLIYGDKSHDIRLLPEDVLYIPPVGPQVAIVGSIHTPAIFEIREGETIGDLIAMAGKTTAVASSARISIERVGRNEIREAMEVKFDDAGLKVPLADGDILRIYSIVPAYQKTVTLRGSVANPGRFSWHEGMHLSDIVPDRDSLMSRDYWWKRSHLGLPNPQFEPVISNLGKDPRTPEYTREGFTDNVSQDTLTRALKPKKQAEGTGGNSPVSGNDGAEDGSAVRPDQGSEPGSTTGGSSRSLASQSIGSGNDGINGIRTSTEVKLTAPEIDWDYAVIERLNPETLKTSLLPFDLGKLVLNHDGSQDLSLEAGDTITIFSQADIHVPLEQQTVYVKLEGEFIHAGVYSALPNETLRELVRRAGGLAGKAYLYGSEFDRESTRVLQQQRIDEYVNRVDLEAERGTLALTSSATSSAGSIASAAGARTAEQDLIARLRLVRATGRIVLRIPPNSASLDDLPDIPLENGDRFSVPARPATINVVGAVNDQNSFEFEPGQVLGRYLRMAGGPDRDADRGHAFVIRADGSVVGKGSTQRLFTSDFKDLRLYPGDTIVVPDKTLRPTALRGLLDWTQIFSQLAIGAAAVEVLK